MQMRGKGIKELNSNRRGSQLVNLQVQIPKYVQRAMKSDCRGHVCVVD